MTPFLALITAAAIYGTVELSDQSEVRVRNAPGLAGPVVDLETTPALKIGVHARRWEIAAGYAPHLSLLQIGAGAQADVLHGAWMSATVHDRVTSISFYEEGSYGDQTFTSLVSDPTIAPVTPQVQPIPAAEIIHYASSRTGCSAKLSTLRRWELDALFEYIMGGGLDASSRAAMPFQAGPHGAIGAAYQASREDSVRASLDVSRSLFSSGEDDTLLQLTESWRHTFGRDTTSTLGAGIGWAATRDSPLDSIHSHAYPVVTAALTRRFPTARVDTELSIGLSPVVDRLNGLVGEWLQEAANATWSPTRAFAVRGQIGAAQSILGTQEGAVAFVYDEIAVSHRLSELVEVHGGARSAWSAGAEPSPFLWVAFVGATIKTPLVRF